MRFFASSGGRNGLSQDAAKLVAFLHQYRDPPGREQPGQNDEFEPTTGFDQFFEGEIDLANEIRAALAGTGFVVVWGRCDPAAENLAGDVSADTIIRQRVHYFGNAGGKLPQSIGEFLRRHTDALYMTDDRFSMTNYRLFQSENRAAPKKLRPRTH